MAAQYGTAVLPARPRKPRDKAKVEVAVQIAQRWILARLRNHRFFSLAELNVAIRRLLDEVPLRVMRGYSASSADLFATLDRPDLQPLPPEPYVFVRPFQAWVSAPAWHPTITSRSTAPGIPCPSRGSNQRSMFAQAARRSRYSLVVDGLRATCAPRGGAAMSPWPTICHRPIVDLPNGGPLYLRSGQNAGAGNQNQPRPSPPFARS